MYFMRCGNMLDLFESLRGAVLQAVHRPALSFLPCPPAETIPPGPGEPVVGVEDPIVV